MTSAHASRRRFLTQAVGGFVLVSGAEGIYAQTSQPPASQQPVPKRPDPIVPAAVEEFVRKAHADLRATKALLVEQPSLLNATWDWGGGDFETGLGGAGHMGNREIAEFLIGQGARLDIFVATMLGRMDIVRAMLSAWPGLVNSKGPHGITLLRHARAGGEAAKPVEQYLLSLGAQ